VRREIAFDEKALSSAFEERRSAIGPPSIRRSLGERESVSVALPITAARERPEAGRAWTSTSNGETYWPANLEHCSRASRVN